MKLKERHQPRKDTLLEILRDLEAISPEFAKLLPEGAKVEVATTDKGDPYILVDGEVAIFKGDGGYFPTVRGALKIQADRRFVTVDKGAIPYVASGADVMRPGVVAFDPALKKGDLVIVNEESHKKPLAIGTALWDGEELRTKDRGKCVKVLQHVGDEVWGLA